MDYFLSTIIERNVESRPERRKSRTLFCETNDERRHDKIICIYIPIENLEKQ